MTVEDQQDQVNIPQLRFPEFSGEWEKDSIDNIFRFIPTNSFSRKQLNNTRGNIYNIHYGDIHTKFNVSFDLNTEDVPYINDNSVVSEITPDTYCREGDVVISDASEDYSDVGKAIEIVNVRGARVVAGLHTLLLRQRENYFTRGVLAYLMQTEIVRKQIMKMANGASVLGISKSNLQKVNLFFPLSSEQRKIADFLGSVDEWISSLRKQKEQLETYKHGLMQQIFSQRICFRDENGQPYPEWEEKKLGDIFEEVREKAGKEANTYKLLSVTLKDGVINQDESKKRDISSTDKSKYHIVKQGDIVYNTMRMWQGAFGLSSFEGIVSPAYTVVRFKEKSDPKFFTYLFKQSRLIFDFYRYSQGLTSDTWSLKFRHFSEIMTVVSSSVEEQQKIADFLSAVDEAIQAKEKHIEDAETWKRGLMQKMFV